VQSDRGGAGLPALSGDPRCPRLGRGLVDFGAPTRPAP